jgi:ribosomal protein L11 methyltransferase
MEYLAYHFTVSPPQPGSEIIMALIADDGFETFDNTENGFVAYIQEDLAININLEELKFDDFKYQYKIEKIPKKNWNAEWEKNFEPVKVDDLLLIRAPFHLSEKNVKQEIVIMPKMSFGTGHHQTTQLMCAAMFEIDMKSKRVLDMGCGTGVLAILAVKLGATDVLGIDIDAWSVENSIENCSNNNCAQIVLKQGDVDLLKEESRFDIILANINKNILKSQLQAYSSKLKTGGKLFLSGFFKTDVNELAAVAKALNLNLINQKSKEEWAMMLLEKV